MNITIPKIPEKTIVLPAKKDILKGIALIAVARARLPGMQPLGLALAATFPAENAYIALIGLCAGTAELGAAALKYIISFLAYCILIYIKKTEDNTVKAVAVGASVLFGGFISFFWTGAQIKNIILLCAEAFVSGGAFYLFSFSGERSERASFAEIILTGAVLNGLSAAVIPYINVNVAVFALIFAAMSLCCACELPLAVTACSVLGFMMSMNGAEAVTAAGALALSALFSSLLSAAGKFGTVVGFLCGITVSALYRGSLEGVRMIDLFVPLGVFALLPEAVHYRLTQLICGRIEAAEEEPTVNARIACRLRTVAKAVCDLADGVKLVSDKNRIESKRREMFGTVASRVCRGCSLESNCWKKDSEKTYRNMNELWETIENEGYCDSGNMPLAFRQVCMRSETFLSEFKHAYELYKQNVLHYGEALSERDIMAKQYGEISNVITSLSKEVETGYGTDDVCEPRRSVAVTVKQEAKPGQTVCGDTVIHFGNENKYFVILCDGMGFGDSAMSESRLAARLFSEFLKAGFEKETAVNMINSALALKADRESFSTVDLLEIDLETGVCEFFKIGSAQSFIKTKSNIEMISSNALPVGILESVEVTAQRRALKPGDVVLMVSDGVGEAGSGVLKNDWIKKLLTMENRNDEELAELIMAGARSRMKYSDDMTCVVIRIKRQEGFF